MRRVFVSCTTDDLAQYRQAAVQVIKELNDEYKEKIQLVEVTMDTEGQIGERQTAVEVSTQWVKTADWIVLIVAWNYGYVAPGETYSVTEWEYRQSQEVCRPPKPCFVYLAGEWDDGEKAYWPLSKDREKINLAQWQDPDHFPVPKEHREQLKKFKNDLRSKRCELFSNLDDFRMLLKKSLKKRIEYEIVKPEPDIRLLQLLRKLEQPIRSCINEVRLLTTLKRIHDRLHRIRQFGIRRWREEVLKQWHEGELPSAVQAAFYRGLSKVNEFLGELKTFLLLLPNEPVMPTVTPKDLIQKVVQSRFGAEGETEDLLDRSAFEKATDIFASRVQRAFSATNSAMLERADVLQRHFAELLTTLGSLQERARAQGGAAWLSRDLKVLQERHEGLQSVLRRHDYWQKMHDKLEQLDNFKDMPSYFPGELEGFLDSREAMDRLLADATQRALASDDAERWQDEIGTVGRHLEAVARYRDKPSYEGMRKAFDDLFYHVDVETLRSVEASEQCASECEMELEELLNQIQARLNGQTVSGSLED
jgi:hypothetical protein